MKLLPLALPLLAAALGTACSAAPPAPAAGTARPKLTGVNIAGGEFQSSKRPGVYGKDYLYPRDEDIAYFAQSGMNTVRVPIRWERVQHELRQTLVATEMVRIDAVVAAASANGMTVILDVHNYAKYAGRPVTEAAVADGLVDLWSRLATRYKGNRVAFGLMNEPIVSSAMQWRGIVDRVVPAIRQTGARNLILVPGIRWTGAHSWTAQPGNSNAEAFAGFADPGANFAFEMHQYLDRDSSGTAETCVSPESGVKRLQAATAWLRQQKARAVLAEFGAAGTDECLATLDRMLAYMDGNGDAWHGWTYWAAGAWWAPNYAFNVQPAKDGTEKPQMPLLKRYLVR